MWFTEDTGEIFGDKLEKERTVHLTEKFIDTYIVEHDRHPEKRV